MQFKNLKKKTSFIFPMFQFEAFASHVSSHVKEAEVGFESKVCPISLMLYQTCFAIIT